MNTEIKVTVIDKKQNKGYFEYIKLEPGYKLGNDRRVVFKNLKNNDYLHGFMESLLRSEDCPRFIVLADTDSLVIELENITPPK